MCSLNLFSNSSIFNPACLASSCILAIKLCGADILWNANVRFFITYSPSLFVDMLLRNSIFARIASNRYMLTMFAFDMLPRGNECRYAADAILPQSRFAFRQNISSPRRGYIEPPQAAYRATRQRRISTSSRRVRHTTDSTCPVRGNISTG